MGPIFLNILLAALSAWIAFYMFKNNKKFKWLIVLASPLALPLAIYMPFLLNARSQHDSSDGWIAMVAVIGIAFCYVGSAVGVVSTFIAKDFSANKNQ